MKTGANKGVNKGFVDFFNRELSNFNPEKPVLSPTLNEFLTNRAENKQHSELMVSLDQIRLSLEQQRPKKEEDIKKYDAFVILIIAKIFPKIFSGMKRGQYKDVLKELSTLYQNADQNKDQNKDKTKTEAILMLIEALYNNLQNLKQNAAFRIALFQFIPEAATVFDQQFLRYELSAFSEQQIQSGRLEAFLERSPREEIVLALKSLREKTDIKADNTMYNSFVAFFLQKKFPTLMEKLRNKNIGNIMSNLWNEYQTGDDLKKEIICELIVMLANNLNIPQQIGIFILELQNTFLKNPSEDLSQLTELVGDLQIRAQGLDKPFGRRGTKGEAQDKPISRRPFTVTHQVQKAAETAKVIALTPDEERMMGIMKDEGLAHQLYLVDVVDNATLFDKDLPIIINLLRKDQVDREILSNFYHSLKSKINGFFPDRTDLLTKLDKFILPHLWQKPSSETQTPRTERAQPLLGSSRLTAGLVVDNPKRDATPAKQSETAKKRSSSQTAGDLIAPLTGSKRVQLQQSLPLKRAQSKQSRLLRPTEPPPEPPRSPEQPPKRRSTSQGGKKH
ncbi:MAG: hypothetical protein ACHQJ6_03025 [Candidatus Berkiellales bacterium]